MAFNVLVVDDSAVMRQMVVRTLKMSGLPLGTVLEAGNGEEGLFVLQDQWVDLLLLDINMPVMNGEEMLRRIRASPETEKLPVIVVSGHGLCAPVEPPPVLTQLPGKVSSVPPAFEAITPGIEPAMTAIQAHGRWRRWS